MVLVTVPTAFGVNVTLNVELPSFAIGELPTSLTTNLPFEEAGVEKVKLPLSLFSIV